MVQLLTDPRFTDDDFHFFNDDPLAPPTDDLTHIADTPTGSAFRSTYDKLCRGKERKQLMGVMFYIDAAVTGQFAALPVLILKMSLTIFTRDARKKPRVGQFGVLASCDGLRRPREEAVQRFGSPGRRGH